MVARAQANLDTGVSGTAVDTVIFDIPATSMMAFLEIEDGVRLGSGLADRRNNGEAGEDQGRTNGAANRCR